MIPPNDHASALESAATGDDCTGHLEPPDKSRIPSIASQHSQYDLSQPSQHQSDVSVPPVQKRQRVTRACDECRRKKIKCDGKQPCTHCTVYSYPCTFDQPSHRRRNPPPQYVEGLEQRLQLSETLLKLLCPDVDLDRIISDARLESSSTTSLHKMVAKIIREQGKTLKQQNPEGLDADRDTVTNDRSGPSGHEGKEVDLEERPGTSDEGLLEAMVDPGHLDLDDEGHWDYHGQSSGLLFIEQLKKIGNMFEPANKFQPPVTQTMEMEAHHHSPNSPDSSSSYIATADLPSRDVAKSLCQCALDDACAIMCFMHKPSFFVMLDRIYDIPPDQFTNEEHTFLPLLYLALAVGGLFSTSNLDKFGYRNATDRAYLYYKAGRQMIDITECRDLTSLQAVLFMVLFLQSSADLSTCYSYIGIALRSALRLGLHRNVTANFNLIEQETRKRVFWYVRKMDVHVSIILGLPAMLSEDDIDQQYPLAVDDEYITANAILPMPPNQTPYMAGIIAHLRLGRILTKVTKYIYPMKTAGVGANNLYMVRHSKIRELERDLRSWHEELPDAFKPGAEGPPQIERVCLLLRIGYAHVQMVMYRPFLHYVTGGRQDCDLDKRSYACAAACVSVARNVVHLVANMTKKGFLNGSYWFTMHTTYFAILSLLFFILENPDSTTARDGILKDAIEGKNTLAGLAKKSMAADRCTQSLSSIFKHLPEKLRNGQPASVTAHANRKRRHLVSANASNPGLSSTSFGDDASEDGPGSETEWSRLGGLSTYSSQTGASNTHNGDSKRIAQHKRLSSHNPPTTPATGAPSRQKPRPHYRKSMSLSGPPMYPNDKGNSEIPTSLNDATGFGDPGMRPPPLLQSALSLLGPPQFAPQQPQEQPPKQRLDDFALGSPNYIPDLMPIMFPSDDPFAYPTQPMSMLEDGPFKNNYATNSTAGPAMQSHVPSTDSIENPATPTTTPATANFMFDKGNNGNNGSQPYNVAAMNANVQADVQAGLFDMLQGIPEREKVSTNDYAYPTQKPSVASDLSSQFQGLRFPDNTDMSRSHHGLNVSEPPTMDLDLGLEGKPATEYLPLFDTQQLPYRDANSQNEVGEMPRTPNATPTISQNGSQQQQQQQQYETEDYGMGMGIGFASSYNALPGLSGTDVMSGAAVAPQSSQPEAGINLSSQSSSPGMVANMEDVLDAGMGSNHLSEPSSAASGDSNREFGSIVNQANSGLEAPAADSVLASGPAPSMGAVDWSQWTNISRM